MELACKQTLGWRHHPRWATHVNVHPSELGDPMLADRTARVLDATGLAGELVCLEITEKTLVSEDAVVRRNVHRLRDLGLGLAIDDFGVAYSSFAYLKRLPLTLLKIDRSFVAGVGTDRQDDAILATVVAMSEALGLVTVAEGVETRSQASRLSELGVDAAQGWLYAPAVAPADWDRTVTLMRGRQRPFTPLASRG